MKKIMVTALALMLFGAGSAFAQTTTSEGNAANSAQSKSGNAKESSGGDKARARVSRTVTGSRPEQNDLSDKMKGNRQADRESRNAVQSDADGKTSPGKVRPKADPKTKKKRSNGRSFGNTGSDTQ